MTDFIIGWWILLSIIPVYVLNVFLSRIMAKLTVGEDRADTYVEVICGCFYLFGTAALVITISGFWLYQKRSNKLNPFYWIVKMHNL